MSKKAVLIYILCPQGNILIIHFLVPKYLTFPAGRHAMRKKIALAALIVLAAATIFAQNTQNTGSNQTDETIALPSQSFRTHLFDVEKFSIMFGYEHRGFGEVLTTEFNLKNKTDDELELYIYAIATYEVDDFNKSSFNLPRPGEGEVTILNFIPYPIAAEDNDKPYSKMKHANFLYKTGKESNPLGTLQKFPRDPKLGIDPTTGGPYKLKDSLFVKTRHVSKYRKNYVFFNHVTLLIFDAKNLTDEKGNLNPPLFRQVYRVQGKRK